MAATSRPTLTAFFSTVGITFESQTLSTNFTLSKAVPPSITASSDCTEPMGFTVASNPANHRITSATRIPTRTTIRTYRYGLPSRVMLLALLFCDPTRYLGQCQEEIESNHK